MATTDEQFEAWRVRREESALPPELRCQEGVNTGWQCMRRRAEHRKYCWQHPTDPTKTKVSYHTEAETMAHDVDDEGRYVFAQFRLSSGLSFKITMSQTPQDTDLEELLAYLQFTSRFWHGRTGAPDSPHAHESRPWNPGDRRCHFVRDGRQCKKRSNKNAEYCWQHLPVESPEISANGPPPTLLTPDAVV